MTGSEYYRRDWDDSDEDDDPGDDYIDDDDDDDEDEPEEDKGPKSSASRSFRAPPDGGPKIRDWLVCIIISLVPIIGQLCLIAWSFIDITKPWRKKWAKAALGVEAAAVCLALLFFPDIQARLAGKGVNSGSSGTVISSSGRGESTQASAENSQKAPAKKEQTVKFKDGAVLLKFATENAYYESRATDTAITYESSEADGMLTVVWIEAQSDMTATMTKEAKEAEGKEISGYSTAANKNFTLVSYKNDTAGTYEYELYGKKGDYIMISSPERVTITGIGYVSVR